MRLKKLSPDTRIVFVTGYVQYAYDAYQIRAHSYILKPLEAEKVREELKFLTNPFVLVQDKLCVRCFRHFEVYWQDNPLIFKRKQTKELFAFLIDREGGACTAADCTFAVSGEGSGGQFFSNGLRNDKPL